MNREERKKRTGWLVMLGAAAVMAAAAVLLTPAGSAAPEEEMQVSTEQTVLAEGSELMQTLSYTRCNHTVTRRVTAPVELYGKNLHEVEAMYPDWKVTEFSAAMVRMEKQPELFCPDHLVIMPNGAGYLCVYENRYGDAMTLVRELALEMKNLPAAVQEEAARGVGFSTAEEAEAWLESVES